MALIDFLLIVIAYLWVYNDNHIGNIYEMFVKLNLIEILMKNHNEMNEIRVNVVAVFFLQTHSLTYTGIADLLRLFLLVKVVQHGSMQSCTGLVLKLQDTFLVLF